MGFEGRDWALSVQRRVIVAPEEYSNRGILPVWQMPEAEHVELVVPLLSAESIWFAFDLPHASTLTGSANGRRIMISDLGSPFQGRTLWIADAIEAPGTSVPIDQESCPKISDRRQLHRPQLEFEVNIAGARLEKVSLALTSEDLFSAITGLDRPMPTSAEDAYGGWRLP